ncbi:FkbM family methyltransferase [Microvirga sp. W0021]|uniref:FkbM family methyltransferase n=1 Tax=Hohaiivirga grylli TaxID=3133970 RepID=A0ABV0BIT2_9HYPH
MARQIDYKNRTLFIDDAQPTFWDKFCKGLWEPETLSLIDDLLAPDTTFIDIGAWVGPTSLWASFTAKRVIALEADPVALSQFRSNLLANPTLADHIEVIAKALYPKNEPVFMRANRKPGDSMSSILLASQPQPEKPVWQVQPITPSEVLALMEPDEDIILKMDIEGGEYSLLSEIVPLLLQTRAFLISFHRQVAEQTLGWTRQKSIEVEEQFMKNLQPTFTVTPIGDKHTNSSTFEVLFVRK